MAVANWEYNADSDEEIVGGEEQRFGGKTAFIVVIDASPEMFQEWKEGQDVPFRAALKCCQAVWRSKIVSNQKNHLVSLLFLGTEQSKNSLNFENIYHLQELSTVKVAMIEELNTMKNSDDYDGFKHKIGSSENYDLKELFWLTKIIIDEGKATSFQKKIMYFTCKDSPHSGKPNMQKEAVKKFQDLGKVELSIVAFNDEFSVGNFYSKLVEDESSIIRADNLDALLKVVRVKQRAKRAIRKTTLELGEGIKLAVGVYSFARPARKPAPVQINKRTTDVLEKTTHEYREVSGMPVLKSEERKMLEVQGEQAIFTMEEIKQVKQVHETGMQLIGFLTAEGVNQNSGNNGKSDSSTGSGFNRFNWYRSPGYFIYPDEESITGSKGLFVSLLKRCYALKKIILVKMVLSRGASPKLACLIPSIDLQNTLFPQGFHVFPIPFADEMRTYDFEFDTPPQPTLISLMEKVIKKVTNKSFDILDVYNPVLQYHWRELEKIALDISDNELDEFHDMTLPNEDLMIHRLGDLPEQIKKQLDSVSYSTQKSTATVSSLNMAMEAKNKRLEKLTVAVLRSFLENLKINTRGKKKADLVSSVYDHFDKQGYV